MTKKETPSNQAADLRQRAQAKARADEAKTGETLSTEAARQIHELRVYQIELEMQNEELRRAQEDLEASRQRYFDLYDMAPVGYLTLSETGLILQANLTAATLLGVTRDGLVNQPLTRFILREDQDIYYRHRRQLFETGLPQVCEMRMLRGNADPLWVRLEATVAHDADGTVHGRAVMSDLTEPKRAEEVRNFLAQTSGAPPGKGFFQLLAEYLAESLGMDFVCIDRLEGDGLTARTVAVWNNGKFEDNVSYALKDTPCGDVVGKMVCCFPASVCQFFPKDEVLRDLRAESYIGVTLWSHTNQPIGLIAVIGRRPLANRAMAESVLKLVADRAAGELERQDAEQALQANEKQHRSILQTAMDGFWLVDMQGHLLEVNEAYCRMSGYSKSELLTLHVSDLEVVETSNEVIAHIQKVMVHGEDRFETRHRRKDGSFLDIEASIQYHTLEGGRLVAFLRDITERKRMELELHQARDLLENRVQERTRDLAQTTRQLRALATELILTEERERREIASALHDSLGPLLSFSKRELGTLRKTVPAEFGETLDHVRGQISQAIEQTRSLTVDLSPPTLYTLGLGHAVEELGERFAAEHNFRCVFQSDTSIPSLPDDIQVLLYRSVRELLVNIVKHAQATSVGLTLSMVDNHIRIVVEDDGIGMKEPALQPSDGQRNGFGLFTIRQRLEQAGGRLEIGSPNGQGTLVAVQVPLKATKHHSRRKPS